MSAMGQVGVASMLLGIDDEKFNSAAKRAEKTMDKLAERMTKVAKYARNMLIAGGGAVAAVIKAATDQQDADAKLEAVIRATGGAAGYTTNELIDMASALQKVTVYADEVTQGGMTILATFKNIKGNIFAEAVERMQDMATVMNTDLPTAARQLGFALNDPTRGILRLTRAGIQFTASQKDQIKAFMESGQIVDAQRVILDRISGTMGGAARATANTLTGQIHQLKNELSDMGEVIGFALMPHLMRFVGAIRAFMPTLVEVNKNFPRWLEATGDEVIRLAQLSGALIAIVYVAPRVISAISAITKAIVWLNSMSAVVTGTISHMAWVAGQWAATGPVALAWVSRMVATSIAGAVLLAAKIGILVAAIALLSSMIYQVVVQQKSWTDAAYDTARALGFLNNATQNLGDARERMGKINDKLRMQEVGMANAKDMYEKRRILEGYVQTLQQAVDQQARVAELESEAGMDLGAGKQLTTLEQKLDKARAALDELYKTTGQKPPIFDTKDPEAIERAAEEEERAAERLAEARKLLEVGLAPPGGQAAAEMEHHLEQHVQQLRKAGINEEDILRYQTAVRKKFYDEQAKDLAEKNKKEREEQKRATEQAVEEQRDFARKILLLGKQKSERERLQRQFDLEDLLRQAKELGYTTEQMEEIKRRFAEQSRIDDAMHSEVDTTRPEKRQGKIEGLEDAFRSIQTAALGGEDKQEKILAANVRSARAAEGALEVNKRQEDILQKINAGLQNPTGKPIVGVVGN